MRYALRQMPRAAMLSPRPLLMLLPLSPLLILPLRRLIDDADFSYRRRCLALMIFRC